LLVVGHVASKPMFGFNCQSITKKVWTPDCSICGAIFLVPDQTKKLEKYSLPKDWIIET
jgi:hypothetical protein